MYKLNKPSDMQDIIDIIKDCASMDEMFGTEEELEENDLIKAAGGYRSPTEDIITKDKK